MLATSRMRDAVATEEPPNFITVETPSQWRPGGRKGAETDGEACARGRAAWGRAGCADGHGALGDARGALAEREWRANGWIMDRQPCTALTRARGATIRPSALLAHVAASPALPTRARGAWRSCVQGVSRAPHPRSDVLVHRNVILYSMQPSQFLGSVSWTYDSRNRRCSGERQSCQSLLCTACTFPLLCLRAMQRRQFSQNAAFCTCLMVFRHKCAFRPRMPFARDF